MDLRHARPTTLTYYETRVLDALRRIVGHLDEALDLESLAAPACMAPLHFHRVFRGLVGETPLQLHRRLRLERAARRLADGTDTVLRIALDAGYDTHEAFTRAFRDAFGRTPSEHRTRARHGAGRRPDFHRLQAACGLHADGPAVALPPDLATLLQRTGASTMHVAIDTCPPLRVAALAHTGPYNTIGAAFERLGGVAGPAGLLGPGEPRLVAIYFDDPETVPAAQLRSAAGVVVPADAALPPGMLDVTLPAGRWAHVVHRGSYAGLGDAWQRFVGHWLPASGHRMRAAECYELYLNHPGNATESGLQTALYVPLEGD